METCMEAIEKTNLFHKQLPNKDRLFSNVCSHGKTDGTKDLIVKLLARYFVKEVYNGFKYLKTVKLPTETGN